MKITDFLFWSLSNQLGTTAKTQHEMKKNQRAISREYLFIAFECQLDGSNSTGSHREEQFSKKTKKFRVETAVRIIWHENDDTKSPCVRAESPKCGNVKEHWMP